MSKSHFKGILAAYLASMVLLHAFLGWKATGLIHEGYPDFTIFYSAARMIRGGLSGELYDPAAQFRSQQEFASRVATRQSALPYNHPPYEALLFVPISWLPYWAAFVIWDVVNLAILFFLARLVRPHLQVLKNLSTPACLFASLAFFPVFIVLLQAQDSLLFLLVLTLAFIALKSKRDYEAGIWLGLGLFRFHLLLSILAGLLWQRRYRVVPSFLSVACVLAIVSVFTVGWRQSLTYPSYVWHMEGDAAQQGMRAPLNMPNLRGLLAMTHLPLNIAPVGKVITMLLALGLIIFMAVMWKQMESIGNPLGFCLALLSTVITAYHSFAHDLCILLLMTAILTDYVVTNRMKGWNAIALLGPAILISCTPLNMYLWFRRGQFALIVVVLLFWFWAIWRSTHRTGPERVGVS